LPASVLIDVNAKKTFNVSMTATMEQIRSDLGRILDVAQHGEEVIITRQGKAVAKLTGMSLATQSPNRAAWLTRLGALRQRISACENGTTIEQIIEEDRGA
jgi:prevent-host-death family protein